MMVNRSLKIALAAVALFTLGLLPPSAERALAQATQIGPGSQNLTLEVNEGQLVRLSKPATSVFIANSDIADVSVKSPGLIYLFGKRPGETTLYALDGKDNVIINARVTVSHNMSRLNSALNQLLPAGAVSASSLDGGIILTGAVATAADAENARRLAARFVGQGEDIINRVVVTQSNQVNLRVRIAEVTKSIIKDLGFSWEALITATDDLFFGITTGTPTKAFVDGGLQVDTTVTPGDLDLNNLIDALATDGLVTILAEPNLTALSGETASFLAGGEFPIPASVDNGEIGFEFKEFGVSLAFTPTILSQDRISMRVRPEVSELTNVGEVETSGIKIPGISTRRAETTVELASGQSFAIAGLTLDSRLQDYDDIPGFGSIPLLGSLFQRNRLESKETELLIVITPYVVRPTATMPPLPTDPYIAPRQASAGGQTSMAASQTRTIPLNRGTSSADASRGQSGFILE